MSPAATMPVTRALPASAAITIVRRSRLSASWPAGSPATSMPMACSAANSPARPGEPVSPRIASG